jgi:hypothetical protein
MARNKVYYPKWGIAVTFSDWRMMGGESYLQIETG